jgi:flagellum-specific peptidoglycan hydrolase FlgJ
VPLFKTNCFYDKFETQSFYACLIDMKKENTPPENGKKHNSSLHVLAKEGQIIRQNNAENGRQRTGLRGSEIWARFLIGLYDLRSSARYARDFHLEGIGYKKQILTFSKVSILLIIMFFVFVESVDFDFKSTNFGSEKNKIVEKTHSKHASNRQAKPSDAKMKTSQTTALSDMSFDLSPASLKDLPEISTKAYIERFSAIAVSEMDRSGVPASISMAQAIVESRSGNSVLARRNNNFFGIKCFSKMCPKGHCSNFTDDHHKDFFRTYKNQEQSWQDHSDFLMKHRYRVLKKFGKNYKAWARGLRDFGYATDPNYDRKLISVIEKYGLDKLDDL